MKPQLISGDETGPFDRYLCRAIFSARKNSNTSEIVERYCMFTGITDILSNTEIVVHISRTAILVNEGEFTVSPSW